MTVEAERITRDDALHVMKQSGLRSVEELEARIASLSVSRVGELAEGAGLVLNEALILNAVTALQAGKHLMLRGAPGTGKTTLALVIAQAAAEIGICQEPMLTTGTADWTSIETVGTYRLTRDEELEFRPGHVLAAMRDDRWLVIDELNRADIDKAIGQLFTVLSGHPVTLPFEVDANSNMDGLKRSQEQEEDGSEGAAEPDFKHVSIVPPGSPIPDETVPLKVARNWRLITTLNDQDQDLLFTMSEALRRRFAILTVPTPSRHEWEEILKLRGSTGSSLLDDALVKLVTGPAFEQHPLGAAVVLDAASHLRRLLQVTEEAAVAPDERAFLEHALDLYIRPHLRLPTGEDIEVEAQRLLASEDETAGAQPE